MNNQELHSAFSELIAQHQRELYGYIFAIVRNWEDANDLFQSVCLVLWSKFPSFRQGTSFFSWARQTAKFEVRKYLARKHIPHHVSESLLDTLAEVDHVAQRHGIESGLSALRHCREKLNATDEELLRLRYVDGLSTIQIAERLQRLQPSISRSLNRIRRSLFECIEKELGEPRHSEEGV
jgi:RNA polymerase sigma-70 factor (ECF subfamily)